MAVEAELTATCAVGQSFTEIASVLDCVYSAGDSIFYVLDMLYWKGQPVCDCSAELRLFLMSSRLQEAGFSSDSRDMQDFTFVPLACFPCTSGMPWPPPRSPSLPPPLCLLPSVSNSFGF